MMETESIVENAIAVACALSMVAFLAFALLRWERDQRRRRRARQDVVLALAAHFGLSRRRDDELEGRIDARHVQMTFGTESLSMLRIELRRPVVPSRMKIVEFADGPYQKYEELHLGGAHETGDPEFDRLFLVYGRREQSVPEELRRMLIAHPLESMSLTREALSRPLSLDVDRAISTVEAAIELCDRLEALPIAD